MNRHDNQLTGPDPGRSRTFHCPMCRRDAAIGHARYVSGRHVCAGCAGMWYEDDHEDDKKAS